MKPNLVMLHGWASHPQVWRVMARKLDKTTKVHLPALPGYASEDVCTPYTLDNIAATLAHAAPMRCTVVGWSLGAQAALTWARRAPEQIERLVLIGATPCFMQRTGWAHGTAPPVLRQFASTLEQDAEAVLGRFVALQSNGDARAVRVAHQLRTALFTQAPPSGAALKGGLDILRTSDLREDLSSVAQPVLVLHGDKDSVTPVAAGQYLAAHLPRARFELFADCGHAPFLSDADRVAALIEAFVSE